MSEAKIRREGTGAPPVDRPEKNRNVVSTERDVALSITYYIGVSCLKFLSFNFMVKRKFLKDAYSSAQRFYKKHRGNIHRGVNAVAGIGKHVATRRRNKRPGSYTKTKLKKKSERTNNEEIHSGVSSKSLRYFHKKHPKIKGLGSMIKARIVNSGSISANPGSQAIGTVALLGTSDQFGVSSGVAGANPEIGESAKSFFSLNPNEGRPAGTLYAASTSQAVDFLLYKGFTTHLALANFESCAITAQVYLLECLHDNPAAMTPQACFSAGMVVMAAGQPANVLPTENYAAQPVWGYTDSGNVHVHPNSSPVFKENWKIRGVRKIELANGASCNLSVNVVVNEKRSREQMLDYPVGQHLRGEFGIMVVAYAAPVVDYGASNHSVTYGPVQLGFIANTEHVFAPYSVASKRNATDTFVGLTPGGAAVKAVAKDINIADAVAVIVDALA